LCLRSKSSTSSRLCSLLIARSSQRVLVLFQSHGRVQDMDPTVIWRKYFT